MGQSLINEAGNIYGNLKVLKRARNPKNGKMEWLCKCLGCNTEKFAKGSDLRGGRRTSCSKCRSTIINETGNEYGLLKVLEKDPTPARQFADRCVHWICECSCENHTIISVSGKCLRNGDTKSCGCLKSSGEILFSSILNELNIPYQKEYTFPDLFGPSGTNKLRFDFALFHKEQLICLIEYNGEQHEKEVPYFKHPLEYNKNNDELKRQYCMKHDIPLFTYTHIKGKLPNREDVAIQIKNDYEEILNEISC